MVYEFIYILHTEREGGKKYNNCSILSVSLSLSLCLSLSLYIYISFPP